MKATGFILIIGGMFLFAFHRLEFPRQRMLADANPIEINKEENKTIQWPIYGGGLVLIAGLIFITLGKKKNKSVDKS